MICLHAWRLSFWCIYILVTYLIQDDLSTCLMLVSFTYLHACNISYVSVLALAHKRMEPIDYKGKALESVKVLCSTCTSMWKGIIISIKMSMCYCSGNLLVMCPYDVSIKYQISFISVCKITTWHTYQAHMSTCLTHVLLT